MKKEQYVAVCAWNPANLYPLAQLGRRIADEQGCMLKVMLFVRMQKQCEEHARMLEYVFGCAKDMDAEMRVYYTDQPIEKLIRDGAECLVVSREGKLTGEIRRRMPERRLIVMEQGENYDGEDRQARADFRNAGVLSEGSGEQTASGRHSDGKVDADADAGDGLGAGGAD